MTVYHAYEVVTDGCELLHADPDRAKVEASLDQTLTKLGDGVDSYVLGTSGLRWPCALVARLQFSDLLVPLRKISWKSLRRKNLVRARALGPRSAS
jgi:hypothetical protein